MLHALAQISSPLHRETWVRVISPRLFTDPSDEFKFRKESSAPSGLITWREGERLISSARRTLVAGAKSYMAPVRHFGNRFGQFANRYLDSVLMGQTEPGSYIVTALAPSAATVPLHKPSEASPELQGVAGAYSREVSLSVVKALEATVEALEHFRESGSLSGFDAGVDQGISYEMAKALLGIAEGSDGADVTVEWDTSVVGGDLLTPVRYEFRGSDAPVLDTVANRLARSETSESISVIGRVHLLSKKEADSPGVFGLDSLGKGKPRKYRIRLADSDEYHEAIQAHEESLAIQVSGRLEKEGNLSWIYDAIIVRILGPVEAVEASEQMGRRKIEIEGQVSIDDL
ncbi:hypothetical protein [Streptacidiphilus albus]|uniref:hypothetical protein n=1 Tax=Streptacidiphilus albus TaxID=105425 RepID=UPI00128C0B04|nr:hypothetical protein [Streptacidiphilus albus]